MAASLRLRLTTGLAAGRATNARDFYLNALT